jgi:glycolate oxidase iron-sulfur subunit
VTWVTDRPPLQVELDACVTCGLCLPVCPTFRLTGDESASPRGRLTAIAAVAGGVVQVDARFDEITSFCLQCRACETACPSLVPYGDIIEAARDEAVQQVRHRGRRMERLAIGRILGWPVIMRIASLATALLQRMRLLGRLPRIGEQARGLRPIPVRPPSFRGGSWGSGARTVTLFTGCVADVWFTGVHQATVEVLVAAGYRVEAPKDQTCCGALAAHAGLGRDARRYAARNIEALTGSDVIAVDVAGCGAHLKGYGRYDGAGEAIAASTYDITELIASAIAVGDLPTLEPTGRIVAVVDPCHLEHGQRITDQPRRIIEAAGFTVVDADRGGLCCGAAGLYQLDHPDTGATLGRRKAAAVEGASAGIVAVANAGCEMQLRRFLDDGFDIVHPVELYAAALRNR